MNPRALVAALLLGALALVTALAPATAQGPTVKIGYIATDSFAPLLILMDRHLPAVGVSVQTVRLGGGPEILSQVATGQLNLGGSGMGAAGFNAVAGGLPVEFVAPLHMGYIEDYFTVRKAVWGSQVKRVADLKGRTIALNIRGAAVEWMLEQALRRDGLSIKDVQVKLMPFPDMVPALESGAVDAGIVSEPFPTIAEERGVAVRPLERPAGAKPTPITALFWNSEWARSNPELAHKVMLAFARSVRDLAADGGKGWSEERNLQIVLKFTSAKPEILRKARPHVVDPNLEMDTAVLASMQKFAAELGYLKYKDPLPVEKLFNFTHRDRAIKELGRK